MVLGLAAYAAGGRVACVALSSVLSFALATLAVLSHIVTKVGKTAPIGRAAVWSHATRDADELRLQILLLGGRRRSHMRTQDAHVRRGVR